MKYLDCTSISSELMQLINEAKENLTFITYSLRINELIQDKLAYKAANTPNLKLSIIYGNTQINNNDIYWIKQIPNLVVYQKKNLHAKCYLNEHKAIITSLNLYDYSQSHNLEMGFLFSKEENEEEWEKLMADVQYIKSQSDIIYGNVNETLKKTEQNSISLSYQEQLVEIILKEHFSYTLKIGDDVLSKCAKAKSKNEIRDILEAEGQSGLLRDVIDEFERCEDFIFFEVVDVLDTNDIILKRLDNGEIKQYYARRSLTLPNKGCYVAAKTNDIYFNEYYILKKSSEPFISIEGGNTYVALTTLNTNNLNNLSYQEQTVKKVIEDAVEDWEFLSDGNWGDFFNENRINLILNAKSKEELKKIVFNNQVDKDENESFFSSLCERITDCFNRDYGEVMSFVNQKNKGNKYNVVGIRFFSDGKIRNLGTKCYFTVGDIISMTVFNGSISNVQKLEKSIVPFEENAFSLWENIAKKDCYCIHCGRKMYWSFYRPFCKTCLREYPNIMKEKVLFCHKCGWESHGKLTYNKPLCYNCWQTEKDNIQNDEDEDEDEDDEEDDFSLPC